MDKSIRILIVEDMPTDAELAQREIKKTLRSSVFQRVDTREDFLKALEEFEPDLIVSDYSMPHFDGLTALKLALERVPLTPLIILTGSMNEDTAVECMKAGASNYVIKEQIKRLGQTVIHALGEKRIREERYRAEEALRSSEERFRSIYENATIGLYRSTPDGIILMANPALVRMLGYSSFEELAEKDIEKSIYSEKYPRKEFLDLVEIDGRVSGLEGVWTKKDGSFLYVRESAVAIRDGAGKTLYYEGTIEDITERKRAGEALRESEEKYRGLFTFSPGAIILIGLDGTILDCNPATEFIAGMKRNELVGHSFRELSFLRGENALQIDQAYETLCRGERVLPFAIKIRLRDDTLRWIDVSPAILKKKEKIYAIQVIVTDITERKKAEEALKESEERYRTLVNTLPDALTVTDVQGNIVYVSPSTLRFYGYDENHEVTGQNVLTMVHADYHEKASEAIRTVLAGDFIRAQEFLLYKEDRSVFWGEVSASCLRDTQGAPIGIIIIVRDVTERKKAEEAIRESEERYRALSEAAHDAVFVLNADDTYRYMNTSGARLIGRKPQEVIGKRRTDVFPHDIAERQWPVFEKVLKTGEMCNDVNPISTPVGDVWLSTSLVPLREKTGEVGAVLGISRDITEYKRAEEALRESEERLRQLAENINSVFFVLDLGGKFPRVSYLSPAFEKVWGRKREEIYEQPFLWMTSIHPEDRQTAEDAVKRAISTNASSGEIEYRLLRPDGTIRWIRVRTNPVRSEDGRLLRFVGLADDITERRQAEEEKIKLESQLLQAQKMESVGRLAGGVAHDFNNMLSVILGYVELIKPRVSEDELLLKDVSEIEKAAGRARDITRQLLAFSRKQIIAPQMVDLNTLIAETQNALSRLIGEDIELIFSPKTGLWKIKFDPSQIDQILINLAVNARDAMPQGGRLTIETKNAEVDDVYCHENPGIKPGEYVLMAVSDNGIGMSRDTLSHLFEPFFTTKETGKGTGLGLATVYGIVSQNGGFVRVDSEPGRGAAFNVYIPRMMEQETSDDRDKAIHVEYGVGTILLVEDDDLVRGIAEKMLETMGYTVFSAATAERALVLCEKREGPIDLLLTDVVMPGMNGRELENRISRIRPGIKTLFMSGYTSDAIVHHGVLDEGLQFIQKPFGMAALSRKVREVMGK